MGRDANIRRRDALIIPGGLLVFYSLAAIIYAEGFRTESDFCPDGSWVLINNTCYTAWKLLLPVLLIGIGLILGGALGFRGRPETLSQRLHHGSINHFALALLVSIAAVPLLLLLVQLGRENANDTTYVLTAYGVDFKHTFVLGVATLVGLLALVPYLALYVSDILRRNDFIRAAETYEEEVEEEPEPVPEAPEVLPHEPGYVHPDAEAVEAAGWEEVDVIEETESPESTLEEDFAAPDGEDWPESRDEEAEESLTAAWDAAHAEEPEDAEEPTQEPVEEPPVEDDSWADEAPAVTPLEPLDEPVEASMLDEGPATQHSDAEYYYGYKGPVYNVVELEGIGPSYAGRLAEEDIRTTAGLCAHDAAELAKKIDVPLKTIEGWQFMSELVAVKGIGPQFAEALVRAGVKGVADLKKRSANRIAAQVNAYLEGIETQVVGSKITEHRVEGWKEAAKNMRKVRMKRPEE